MGPSNKIMSVLNLKSIILGTALASGLGACVTEEDCPKIGKEHICLSDSPNATITYGYRRESKDKMLCFVEVRIKEDGKYSKAEDFNCDGKMELLYDEKGISIRSPLNELVWYDVDELSRMLKDKAIKNSKGGYNGNEKDVKYFSLDDY